jgi:YhcH/YjgK/YiaL family protein
MIIDSLTSAGKYTSLHPLFAKAFEYIGQQNLALLEPGKFEIEGNNLKAIVSDKQGMSAAESIAKFECHNKHIDIQVCISGREKIGWKPRTACIAQNGAYNEEKDVVFYNDAPDTYFELTGGQFAIFYPEDVHAPMIGEGIIKKLVIKVRL